MGALPNGPFVRPHPALWRVVLGLSFLYWMGLVIALFQDYKALRHALFWLDVNLTPEPRAVAPEDSPEYAADCSFTFNNLWSRVDIFIVAHFFGWVVKALMIRSLITCWLISIFWELTEIHFAPLLPNFYECWWDQWLYDVLLCNGLGILVGRMLAYYFEMKQYHWRRFGDIPTRGGKVKRALLQFTPESWTVVRWCSTPLALKRYFQIILLVLASQVLELNSFFLKHIFEVPTKHQLNMWRLALVTVISCPAIRQYYIWCMDPTCKRLGVQSFVAIGILLTESTFA